MSTEPLACVTLTCRHGTATVLLFGATLISFRVQLQQEEEEEEEAQQVDQQQQWRDVVYLSPAAIHDGVTPTRGGVPIVFPQFGAGALIQHGFARRSLWHVARKQEDCVVLELRDGDATRTQWPFAFCLSLEVRLIAAINDGACPSLRMTLRVSDCTARNFQSLLHTYIHTPTLEGTSVSGLADKSYVDKVDHGNVVSPLPQATTETRINIVGEVDRVYDSRPSGYSGCVHCPDGRVDVNVRCGIDDGDGNDETLPACFVLWNPGPMKAAAMKDLTPDSYHNFVCLEAGALSTALQEPLTGSRQFYLQQTLSFVPAAK